MTLTECVGNRLIELSVVVMLTAWASPLTAATDHPGSARVNYVEGRPMFSKAGEAFKMVERDMVLRAGDVLKTAANSKVDLDLGYNNGVATLSPNSELAFDKLAYQHVGMQVVCDTEFNLSAGQISGELKKLSPGSTYLVKTPRGVAAIKDGHYVISADGTVQADGGTVIMALTMNDGKIKAFTVTDGNTLNPADPSNPVITPTPPSLKPGPPVAPPIAGVSAPGTPVVLPPTPSDTTPTK